MSKSNDKRRRAKVRNAPNLPTPPAHPTDPGEPLDDLSGLPQWVIEAEREYLNGNCSSYKAVSIRFARSEYTVQDWGQRRRWYERRRKVEEDAARQLEELNDEAATDDLVGFWSQVDRTIKEIGQRALHLEAVHVDRQVRLQRLALDKDQTHPIIPPPAQLSALVARMMTNRPRPPEGEGAMDVNRILDEAFSDSEDGDDAEDDDASDDGDNLGDEESAHGDA